MGLCTGAGPEQGQRYWRDFTEFDGGDVRPDDAEASLLHIKLYIELHNASKHIDPTHHDDTGTDESTNRQMFLPNTR